ncbi:hypothetical protein OH733_05190 [Streptomyces griseus]|uniref:hypothetical protein n=1 Tax=Streptomyces griseus TaxID=1911 RepID=UPI00386ABDA7|nr:hypothetical protein OH733_05190 [Streptomyces griseus]WTD71204.1 hypothetical protein OH763_31795 [Streptomyces griseus]
MELLEDPTFDSAEQLAKSVIKEVADMLQMRDMFALVHTWQDGSKGLNFGPMGSVAEAEAFAKKMAFGGTGKVVPLTSSGVMLANHEGVKGGYPGYCYDPTCGHAPWTHALDGASRGACRIEECKCDRMIKDDPAAKKKKTTARKAGAAKGVNEL